MGSSSEGKGDAVLGVPGVDGGEAMLDGSEVAFWRRARSHVSKYKRKTAQQQCQCGSRGYVEGRQPALGIRRLSCCRLANEARPQDPGARSPYDRQALMTA